jgi:hypothetical protein
LRPIAALGKLVLNLFCPGLFGHKAFLLYVTVNSIELMNERVELLLLLLEGVLASKDARLSLALILLSLDGGLIVPMPLLFHGGVAMKSALSSASSAQSQPQSSCGSNRPQASQGWMLAGDRPLGSTTRLSPPFS